MSFNVVKIFKATLLPPLTRIVSKAFSEKYLIFTNLGLSTSLTGIGDLLEQKYEIMTGEMEEWNKVRTRNMALSGLAVGYFVHHWYRYLERALPGRTLRVVLKKILVDQLISSPITISTFFITTGILEGKKIDEFIKEVKQKAWKLYLVESLVWPPAQFINFYFLPYQYRILFDNSICLGYDIYMSKVKHGKTSSTGEKIHLRPVIPKIIQMK